MIAKCGPRVLHHWAHHGRRNCDPWWENETDWHRQWKNLYPLECREISHVAPDGEIHRADIKTPSGIVVEIQHSAMTDEERTSREAFYGNLVWLIDGYGFKENFDIYHMLPNPNSKIASDLIWSEAKRHLNGANRGLFMRRSEGTYQIHGIHEIQDEVSQCYNGYHQYDWIRPRNVWLEATCPVYIDFGERLLVKLGTYDSTGLKCIRFVSKKKFVHDTMFEKQATDIASRFYPLDPLNSGSTTL